jgi:hypothetical protein
MYDEIFSFDVRVSEREQDASDYRRYALTACEAAGTHRPVMDRDGERGLEPCKTCGDY